MLIRWRYQRAGSKRYTDVEIIMSRGRVVAARIGSRRGSYVYDDPRSLVDLQRLLATMPQHPAKLSADLSDWWDGE